MYRVFLLIAKDLLVPLGLIFWQWKGNYNDKFGGIVMSLLSGLYVAFAYLTAEWAIYGYYWRYLLPFLWVLATIHLFWRIRAFPFRRTKQPREKFWLAMMLFFILLFGALSAWAMAGKSYSGKAVSLAFPLQGGVFYIAEGGDSPVINTSHHTLPPIPQKYALDIIALNESGRRANGFFPDKLADYAIYGQPVFSPVSGTVISVVDSFPDVISGGSRLTEAEAYGNTVIIGRDSLEVLLAQLQSGSIRVAVGDSVIAGQQIAAVGCSGDAAEPHLHIHATLPAQDAQVRQYWSRSGIPMLFEGKFLAKNDRVVR